MSDIVERLKSQNELYVQKYVGTHDIDETKIEPLCEEAAAEITRLREELAAAQSRITDLTKISATLNVRTSKLNALREENARLRDLLAEGDAALSWVLLEGIDEAYPTTCPVEYARIVDAAKAIAAAIREGGKVKAEAACPEPDEAP